MNKEDFVKTFYSGNYINKMIKKVKMLGIQDKTDVYNVIILRLVSSIIVFISSSLSGLIM